MSDLAIALPRRRPELVARPFGESGPYLIRDRHRGESFQLGPEEYFLLARLDGTRTAPDLCAAFAERFGEPLTEEELGQFLELAHERGFLQPEGARAPIPLRTDSFPDDFRPPHSNPGRDADFPRRAEWTKWLAVRLLKAAAAVLQWVATLLSAAAGKLQWARLAHVEFVARPDDIFIVTYPGPGPPGCR
jgi:hypothetical protein